MDIAIALLSHGEVLRDFWSTLLCKVRCLALSQLLLGAASHQLPDEDVLIVKTLLITEEDASAFTIATDRKLSVLNILGPVELYKHVVVTLLEIFIFFPCVTVLTHFAVLVYKILIVSVSILDLGNYEAYIGVVVVDRALKATLISLVDTKIVMTTGRSDLETNKCERVCLMARLEERVLVVVVDAAHLDAAEVFYQISLAHEEGTIISVAPASDFLRRVSPAVRVIAPVTLPLEVAPRVAKLVEANLILELVLNLDAAKESI